MRKLLMLALLCPYFSYCQPLSINGRIINEDMEPVAGATVVLKRTGLIVLSDDKGEFRIADIKPGDSLQITAVGYVRAIEPVNGFYREGMTFVLRRSNATLKKVIINTGYQILPRERSTGSFALINNELLQRNPSTGILDRIENLAPGLLFNKADNQINDPITIRGRSTIFASSEPLIVLDNFPFDGNIASINPADVENITVLKDAAAASIWGARAGNGVIVITTKKGRTTKPRVDVSSYYTVMPKPDLFSIREISPGDFIELERFLYNKGFYNSTLSAAGNPPVTPVVELLAAQTRGTITPAEANEAIEAMKNFDIRQDVEKYLYQTAINRQFTASLSGNTGSHNYFFSAGYDCNTSSLVSGSYDRFSVLSNNTFRFASRFEADASIRLAIQNDRSGANTGYGFLNNGFGKGPYPYARLVDENGAPLPFLKDYRASFAASPGDGLLPWEYNPIADLNEVKNLSARRDYVMNLALRYKIAESLVADVRYQYGYGQSLGENEYNAESWFARNLINQYTQVSPSGQLTRPVPLGGILHRTISQTASHQLRAQLNFSQSGSIYSLNAIAGAEVKDLSGNSNAWRFYGFNRNGSLINTSVDYTTRFARYDNPFSSATIPYPSSLSGTVDRYMSYFSNAAFTFKSRYTASASARQDASNLFGVTTNQQAIPLWSAGLSWDLHHEPFYKAQWLSQFRLRATYGSQGNISRRTSAFTTAKFSTSPATGFTTATIQNPPNERLRWERVRMINFGIDFTLYQNKFSGSIEYYLKKGTDLMGIAPVDPTWGLAGIGGGSEYFGNIAGMKGKGIDLQMDWPIIDGPKFQWQSSFIMSYASNEVTEYVMPVSAIGMSYLSEATVNPVLGKPLFALYSFPWAGLDPVTGNPQGLVSKQPSADYISIITKTALDSMMYHGPIAPEIFGSMRNQWRWKNLTCSFVWSYKLGYYFRKPSIHYANLFNTWTGHSDYALRWQQPGDEQFTDVPSLVYPANTNRDRFYASSSVLVERADHIRFEDLNFTYAYTPKDRSSLKELKFSVVVKDLGVIWTRNTAGIDPYYTKTASQRPSIAFGLTAIF